MKEMDLLNNIRLLLQQEGILTFRTNVGKVKTPDGRYFDTGLPKGFSDLFCIRPDGKAVFIECKIKPNKPTIEQCRFLVTMQRQGCPAGVAFSMAEALEIAQWDDADEEKHSLRICSYLTRYQ